MSETTTTKIKWKLGDDEIIVFEIDIVVYG